MEALVAGMSLSLSLSLEDALLILLAVPDLLNISNIVGAQIANVGSPDIVRLSTLRLPKS